MTEETAAPAALSVDDQIKAAVSAALQAALPIAIAAAVAAAPGPLKLVVAPVLDEVDTLLLKVLNAPAPANAVAAPTDPASQIAQLQQHVAALILTTNNAHVGALNTVKAAVAAPAAA